MSTTRTAAIANTREMMDATSSARWSDTWISTVLGIVGEREWIGILGANPYYRFVSQSVTTSAAGQFDWTSLDSGSADTKKWHYRVLSMSDGYALYKQTQQMAVPLATTTNYQSQYMRLWFDAGDQCQIIPVAAVALTVAVSWKPVRIDNLATGASVIDFPDGSEVILWLEAAAMLLSKGGMENDAAQTMRAMADQERQKLYQQITRRGATPTYMGLSDDSSDWGG